MTSEQQLLATLIERDPYFMDSAAEQLTGEILKDILRLCHDYNHPKFDATFLVAAVTEHIAEFVSADDHHWPEPQGAGYVDWEAADRGAMTPEAPVEEPVDALPPLTGMEG